MLTDLLVALKNLWVVLELVPDPLDQLLKEGVLHRRHELLVPRIDSAIAVLLLHDNPLDAEKVDLVQVVNQEKVIAGGVHHRGEEHQAFKIDFFDLLFDEFMVENGGHVDKIRADGVDVECDSAIAILVALGHDKRSCHLVISVSDIHHAIRFRVVH